MMKKIVFTLIFAAACCFSFPESIVGYKGMEAGLDYNPDWCEELFENGSESTARKKFKIKDSEKILCVSASSASLESAKIIAKSKIAEIISEGSSSREPAKNLPGAEFVADYWEETSEGKGARKFYYYAVYKMLK